MINIEVIYYESFDMILSNTAKTAILTALNTSIGPNAKIEFYTAANVKLATLTGGDSFGSVTANNLTAGSITRDNEADADGVASYVTVSTSADVEIIRLEVGSEVTLPTANFVTGQPVEMTSLVISV